MNALHLNKIRIHSFINVSLYTDRSPDYLLHIWTSIICAMGKNARSHIAGEILFQRIFSPDFRRGSKKKERDGYVFLISNIVIYSVKVQV